MEKLYKILNEALGINSKSVNKEKLFIDMEEWDSMAFMFFITAVEEEFNIQLTNDEIIDINCIEKAELIIKSKISN